MDTALWIVQSLLAGIFLATGLIKLPTAPQDGGGTDGLGRRRHRRAVPHHWAAGGRRRCPGLILPGALGIAPGLAVAALGLVLTMIGAIVTHVRYGETGRLAVPIVLLGLALFVAVERFGAHSL